MRGRDCLEPKDTVVERFWGLIFIGLPNLSDETPKPPSGKPWDQPTKALSVLSQADQTASDISKLRRAGKSVESRFG